MHRSIMYRTSRHQKNKRQRIRGTIHHSVLCPFALLLLAVAVMLSGCGGGDSYVRTHANRILAGDSGTAVQNAGETGCPETVAKAHGNGDETRLASGGGADAVVTEAGMPAAPDASEAVGLLEVHFIDVGQGQAQLLIGPTGKTMLIDGGDNPMEEAVVAYLEDLGIGRIDILIGTHPHADHIGGLDAVVERFDIGKIYMPRVQMNTKTFESLLLAIRNKGLKINAAKAGLTLDWEPDAEVRMIGPVGEYENVNDMSAVVHLAYGETSFLFTGDAEAQSEADILRSGADVGADVLLVGHHGSSTSTSEAFLEKVAPAYAVIQSGDNDYGHPHKEVLNLLAEKGVRIYRNDEHGHIVFTSDGKRLSVRTGKEAGPRRTERPEPAAAVGELAVSASIDNDTPPQNGRLTVTVKATDAEGNPVQGGEVVLRLHYKTTTAEYRGTTGASGIAELSFRIGRASKGYTVKGEITVTAGEAGGRAEVSFTPK